MGGNGEKRAGKEVIFVTQKQNRALAALLTCPTKEQAAQAAGIGLTTLKRYLADPEFQTAYREAVTSLLADATRESQQALSPALSCLREITTDTEASATARIAAARSLLEFGLKLTEFVDIANRLNELEENVSELEGHR